MMKSVCVLTLNYGAPQDTIQYVHNLKQQQGIALSILIIDNCSPDDSYEIFNTQFSNDEQVTVIQSGRNGGYAFGNNVGLRYLENQAFDFLVISNNDISLDDDYLLCKLTAGYDDLRRPAFVAPCMYVNGEEDRKHQAWRLPTYWDDVRVSLRSTYFLGKLLGMTNRYFFPISDPSTKPVDCLSGSFFMGQKDTFYQVGLFDEATFLYGEEAILAQRVKQLGLQNYLIRSLRFHHDWGKTTGRFFSSAKLQRYWLESTVYYQRKYNGIGEVKVGFLRLLFWCWRLETKVLSLHGFWSSTKRQH